MAGEGTNTEGCGSIKLCWHGRNLSCGIIPPMGEALALLIFHSAMEKEKNIDRHFSVSKVWIVYFCLC